MSRNGIHCIVCGKLAGYVPGLRTLPTHAARSCSRAVWPQPHLLLQVSVCRRHRSGHRQSGGLCLRSRLLPRCIQSCLQLKAPRLQQSPGLEQLALALLQASYGVLEPRHHARLPRLQLDRSLQQRVKGGQKLLSPPSGAVQASRHTCPTLSPAPCQWCKALRGVPGGA